MKKLFRVLKNRWPEYLIEIFVIIIGISLTLLLNNWREHRIERKTEVKLLESIRENLVADTLTLNGRLQNMGIFVHAHKQFLSPSIDTFSSDSILTYMDLLATYTMFQGTDVGYQELKQSKSSTTIQNRILLQKVIQHYERKYDLIKEWNDIDKSFVLNDVIPFLNQNIKYKEGPFLHNDAESAVLLLENNDYFKNLIKSGGIYKHIVKLFYARIFADTKILIDEIDTELKKIN